MLKVCIRYIVMLLTLKVYPDQDINNIVESNHYVKINNWCKLGRTKCKGPSRWVKPFRCLGKAYAKEILLNGSSKL